MANTAKKKVNPEDTIFKRVFNRPPSTDEAVALKSEAIRALWQYENCFPNETPEQRDNRLLLDSPAMEEVNDLATHFKTLYPEFKGKVGLEVLYRVYQQYMLDKSAEEQVEDSSTEQVGMITEESKSESTATTADVSNIEDNRMNDAKASSEIDNTISHNKEDIMSEQKSIDKLKEIEEQSRAQIENAGKANITTPENSEDEEVNQNLPTGSNFKSYLQAATTAVKNDSTTRFEYTNAALVEKLVLSKKAPVHYVKGGKDATGRLSNPQAAYNDFVAKTGLSVGENGQVSYDSTKFPQDPENVKRVQEMYALITSAIADPSFQTPAYVSEANGPLVGVMFKAPEASTLPFTIEGISNIIFTKAALQLNANYPNCSIKLAQAKKSTNKNKKQNRSKSSSKKKAFAGVVTLKVTNRKEATTGANNIAVFARDFKPDAAYAEATGLKSNLYIEYYRDVRDEETNEPKKGKYRIPLMVEQRKLEEVEGLQMFCKNGKDQKIFDFSNEDDRKKAMEELSALAAEVLATDSSAVENQFLNAIKATADAVQAQQFEAQQAEMEGSDEL